MSRLLSTLVALTVLALTLWWLSTPSLARLDLGPGDELLARPGAPVFAVRRGASWWWLPADATQAAQARDLAAGLPAELLGPPALAPDGTLALHLPDLLVLQAPDGTRAELTPPAGEGLALVGVDGAGQPLVAVGSPPQLRAFHEGRWLALEVDGVSASPPEGATVLPSPVGCALAFRGGDGWEAWSWGPLNGASDGIESHAESAAGDGSDAGTELATEPPTGSGAEPVTDDGTGPRPAISRVVAEQCVGQDAVYTPDGTALMVEGRTDGLFRLELASGRLSFMSRGNLGASQRVGFGSTFRGDPVLLTAPQRDREGFLQIFQSQLTGGSGHAVTTGGRHHFAPAASADGRLLAYLQASFDEQGGDAFEESVYILDFEQKLADEVLVRRGGLPRQGPVFVGDGTTLVLLADGRVQAIRP